MTIPPPAQPDPERAAQQTTRLSGLPTGQLIGGRYALEQLLGEGGAARVYLARDTVLDRTVALKLLRPEYSADSDFVARFYREARAIAALSHPNIVDIYDYGNDHGTYFIVMQYVPGTDLKALLKRQGKLPPTQVVTLADGLLRGLAAAHERGIIHRDVKPQNILVQVSDGAVILTDFGVARTLDTAQQTAAGTTLGTAHYMAPEQANGGAITHATDLYAVGIVLYEALTGQLPYDAETALQVVMQHLRSPVPAVRAVAPEISPALAQAVEKALAKDPQARYPSAEAFRQALQHALSQPAATALPPVRRPVAPTRGCILPVLATLIIALLVAIVLVGRALLAPPPPKTVTVASVQPTATVVAAAIIPTSPPTFTVPPPSPTATATTVPPTATVLPTTAPAVGSPTIVPSTATPPPPTATPASTSTPTQARPTPSPVPPTATVAIPTATPQQSAQPGQVAPITAEAITGAYRRDDGKLYGLSTVALYGDGTGYNQGTANFTASNVSGSTLTLTLTGLDDERDAHCQFQLVLNGVTIFDGPTTFPNAPANDHGIGGSARAWGQMVVSVPVGVLRNGQNTLILRNRTPSSTLGVPYILINEIRITGR